MRVAGIDNIGNRSTDWNPDYIVSPSRLSDVENQGHTPNLYRLHALSLVYDCRVEKLMKFYAKGLPHSRMATETRQVTRSCLLAPSRI